MPFQTAGSTILKLKIFATGKCCVFLTKPSDQFSTDSLKMPDHEVPWLRTNRHDLEHELDETDFGDAHANGNFSETVLWNAHEIWKLKMMAIFKATALDWEPAEPWWHNNHETVIFQFGNKNQAEKWKSALVLASDCDRNGFDPL